MRKKFLRTAITLLLAVVLTLSLMLTASAEDAKSVTEGGSDKNWNYKATLVKAEATPGMYILIVFKQVQTKEDPSKPTTFSADDILYIDQIVTTETGKVTFENWIPKTYAGGAAWIFGGSISEFIGWLTSHGVALSMSVLSNDEIVPAKITISKNSSVVETKNTEDDGTVTFDAVTIDTGYSIKITKNGYCSYTINNVSIADALSLGEIDIRELAGNVDGDDVIDGFDLSDLVSAFDREGESLTEWMTQNPDKYPDIDGDGVVDGYDLGYLISSFDNGDVVVDAEEN